MFKVSKFFRVATSGKTVDQRELSAQDIKDIAESYNPKKYGARIWLEHFRGMLPDSVFKALGDVIEVEARDVEDNKVALFAKLSPTEDLVKINEARQKIYTSIEIIKDPDTGKPYLGGLAVTDSPASIGTEVLMFSSKHNANSRFTSYIEGDKLEFVAEEESTETATNENLFNKIKKILGKEKDEKFTAQVADISKAVETLAETLSSHEQKFSTIEANAEAFKQLRSEFDDLKKNLSKTPSAEPRPLHTGAESEEKTDC